MVLACFRPFNIAHKHRCLLKNVIYHNVQCNFKHGSLLHFRKSIQTSVLLQRARNETSKIVQDKKSYPKSIKRLLSLAGPEKYPLAAAISLLVISSSVTMSIPFALGKVIDIIYSMDQIKTKANLKGVNHKDQTNDVPMAPEVSKEQIRHNLKTVCAVLIGVFACGALANFGRVYLMRLVSQRIAAKIRNSVYSSIGSYNGNYIAFDYWEIWQIIKDMDVYYR